MPTLVQQLHATRGSRINHYPLGVHGPYLASPWAAARLGQRVFTTKAEYQWRVREDYDPAGRHRLAAVAARIAEREAADALQASTRYRQAIWNGEDPDASGYAQPRVEIRKRHARVEPDERTGHGVKRCIRTPEEEQEVGYHPTCVVGAHTDAYTGHVGHHSIHGDPGRSGDSAGSGRGE